MACSAGITGREALSALEIGAFQRSSRELLQHGVELTAVTRPLRTPMRAQTPARFTCCPSPQGELFGTFRCDAFNRPVSAFGLAEVRGRGERFRLESDRKRRRYLKKAGLCRMAVSSGWRHWMICIASPAQGPRWMVDPFRDGSFVRWFPGAQRASRLHLPRRDSNRGVALFCRIGQGKRSLCPLSTPQSLERCRTDPYRKAWSGSSSRRPDQGTAGVPFLEFHLGAWLRRKPAPSAPRAGSRPGPCPPTGPQPGRPRDPLTLDAKAMCSW